MEKNPTIECVESTETSDGLLYGKFVATPLDQGYGTTLGNSLRRVLLSDLEGAAIFAVRIRDVKNNTDIKHEFSTIDGMVEDVLDLIMNLKKVTFRINDTERSLGDDDDRKVYEVTLEAKGPGPVTSKDIKCDKTELEVINEKVHLATLQDGAEIELRMYVRKGKSFEPSERVDRDKDLKSVNDLPIDAIYMPVHRVNYKVENTRVGRDTAKEKLILEVWTDGSIAPDKAISTSADILTRKFRCFKELTGDHLASGSGAIVEQEDEPKKSREEEISIEELELSIRA